MNAQWFGDSYDIVKRFLVDAIARSGFKVYVQPLFTGEWSDGGAAFLAFIGAELADGSSAGHGPAALFVDPDTGVSDKSGGKHCSIAYLLEQAERYSLVFAFDQSFSRNEDASAQMKQKLQEIDNHGARGFYYDSHARFLFISANEENLMAARNALIGTGLPENKLFDLRNPDGSTSSHKTQP